MFLFVSIFLAIILFWIVGFFIANDFSVPSVHGKEYKNTLVIFPHPDDEVLTTGGLMRSLSRFGNTVSLIILSKGERGTRDASRNDDLKQTRTHEATNVANMLGATLYHKDFGDGEIEKNKSKIKEYIDFMISKLHPDLVITYDLSGLYGHADHIACSEVVTTLLKRKYPNITLWYVTFPKRVLSLISLPEHMAKVHTFKKLRMNPNLKVFVGTSVFRKIQSVYAYKSQFESFRRGLPVKFVPPWFFYSMQLYEYFYHVQ